MQRVASMSRPAAAPSPEQGVWIKAARLGLLVGSLTFSYLGDALAQPPATHSC